MNIDRAVVPLLLLVGYLAILYFLHVRRQIRTRTERLLGIYLFVSALGTIASGLSLGVVTDHVITLAGEMVTLAGRVILAVVLFNLSLAFVRRIHKRSLAWAWWLLSVLYFTSFILIVLKLVPLDMMTLRIGAAKIDADVMIQIPSILAWSGFTLASLHAIWHAFRQATSPMHRNRYRYLILGLLLVVLGTALFASRRSPFNFLGLGARFSSVLIFVLVTYRHNLVDIKTVYRRAMGYSLATLLIVLVGFALMWGAMTVLQGDWIYSVLVGVGLTSVFLTLLSYPLRRGVQRVLDLRLFHVQTANYDQVLRAYGEKVIETLHLEPLADLVISTLIHALGIEYGGLYLANESDDEKVGALALRPLLLLGKLRPDQIELAPDSPLTVHLRESEEPVSQYDIDLQEAYVAVPEADRAWLGELSAELLLPIHASSGLVGLIAIGPKKSGEVYTADEIAWLKSLANQTAVALQNARLFDQVETMSDNVMHLNADLERINDELEQSNVDLEKAYVRLQEVDQLKSEFIGMISHELRSPFVAAGFSVELLARYAERGMLEQFAEQVEQLDRELTTGRQMLDRVISFASLLSKQGQLNVQTTNVRELIHEALAPLEKIAQTRQVVLFTNVDDIPAVIRVDHDRLGEAIYHLVHNAVKFTPAGGQVQVTGGMTGADFVFKVEDTGCGMSQEQLDVVWESFTQGADGLQRGVEGLGLGLPLVKLVVEAHGGEVWASSQQDAGSTFNFRIPQ